LPKRKSKNNWYWFFLNFISFYYLLTEDSRIKSGPGTMVHPAIQEVHSRRIAVFRSVQQKNINEAPFQLIS
jgi:hypothetical protein